MGDKLTVGIDLGGTKILAIVLDEKGAIKARAKSDTPVDLGMEGIGKRMHELADEALHGLEAGWESVQAVGIAVPSAVDQATGVVLHAPALGWKNLPARKVLDGIFKRAVALDNDVNCGVLAEALRGAGKDCRCVVGYFVGTGTGGGIVIDGRLHRGVRGCAGEFGHETIRYKGRRCGCGKRGCLEAYCSKTAFGKRLDRLLNRRGMKSCIAELMDGGDFSSLKSKVLAKAYRREDPVVCAVVDQGVRMLGVAVANMMALLAPDCVVLGGGVMEAFGVELLPKVRASALKELFGLKPDDLNLKLSVFGDDAVALGAALLPTLQAG